MPLDIAEEIRVQKFIKIDDLSDWSNGFMLYCRFIATSFSIAYDEATPSRINYSLLFSHDGRSESIVPSGGSPPRTRAHYGRNYLAGRPPPAGGRPFCKIEKRRLPVKGPLPRRHSPYTKNKKKYVQPTLRENATWACPQIFSRLKRGAVYCHSIGECLCRTLSTYHRLLYFFHL